MLRIIQVPYYLHRGSNVTLDELCRDIVDTLETQGVIDVGDLVTLQDSFGVGDRIEMEIRAITPSPLENLEGG